MPDPKTLKVGDRIQILRVPANDLRQRERELAEKTEMAGWTADSIERIIEQSAVVSVSRTDEYGCVWYDATVVGPDGIEGHRSLIIYDDDTWKRLGTFKECCITTATRCVGVVESISLKWSVRPGDHLIRRHFTNPCNLKTTSTRIFL